ncbi:hypothetical protein AWV79_22060 [Cupriavidus sp. UYMMa02A]|nr:hypothetical protein AWV79_22060 [Cupriavidus sp. UYMMa02A]
MDVPPRQGGGGGGAGRGRRCRLRQHDARQVLGSARHDGCHAQLRARRFGNARALAERALLVLQPRPVDVELLFLGLRTFQRDEQRARLVLCADQRERQRSARRAGRRSVGS